MSYHNNKVYLKFIVLYVFHNGICLHISTPISYDIWNNFSIRNKLKFINKEWPYAIQARGYSIEIIQYNADMTKQKCLLQIFI